MITVMGIIYGRYFLRETIPRRQDCRHCCPGVSYRDLTTDATWALAGSCNLSVTIARHLEAPTRLATET